MVIQYALDFHKDPDEAARYMRNMPRMWLNRYIAFKNAENEARKLQSVTVQGY